MQNIYDNADFFDGYKKLRDNAEGYNDALEQPAIRSLLNVSAKTVLDVGCGFGDFCRYAREQGAAQVIGLEPSRNMLDEAKQRTDDKHIEYVCEPIETFQMQENNVDVIVASLVFHYVQDFGAVVKKIHSWLKSQGQLLFSVEHPLCTALLNEPQEGNYRDEAQVKQTWFIDGIEKYHRQLSTYCNTLLCNGFTIDRVLEPMPTDEQIVDNPRFAIHKSRPPMLVISATCQKGE